MSAETGGLAFLVLFSLALLVAALIERDAWRRTAEHHATDAAEWYATNKSLMEEMRGLIERDAWPEVVSIRFGDRIAHQLKEATPHGRGWGKTYRAQEWLTQHTDRPILVTGRDERGNHVQEILPRRRLGRS